MGRYRNALPQMSGEPFLTDGGLETCLVFHDGIDLPHFAAFDLLKDDDGRAALRRYIKDYVEIAQRHHAGFIAETVTWRASPDWAAKLGYSDTALADANRLAVELCQEVRKDYGGNGTKVVISGCIGPRGDGYDPGTAMSEATAEAYHSAQIGSFAASEADMVLALTMTNVPESIGVTRAAKAAGMPIAVSFTLETDGTLPTGQSLKDAIEAVDTATGKAPAYYMINCAHPSHFTATLTRGGQWVKRIRAIRPNASSSSHAELDGSETLDNGDPRDLGRQCAQLAAKLPHLNVFGGCCGTDERHVAQICRAGALHN